jgi:hypothetical protein
MSASKIAVKTLVIEPISKTDLSPKARVGKRATEISYLATLQLHKRSYAHDADVKERETANHGTHEVRK